MIDVQDLIGKKWKQCNCLDVVAVGIDRCFGFDLDVSNPVAWKDQFEDIDKPDRDGDLIVMASPEHTGVAIVTDITRDEAATCTPRTGVKITTVSMIQLMNKGRTITYHRLRSECVST